EIEVHMKRLTSATLTAIVVLALASITASAQNRLPSNAQRALQWLQCTQQQLNGQIGSGGNPIARSAEVAFGLAAAGQDAAAMKTGGVSLAEYLTTAVSIQVLLSAGLLSDDAAIAHGFAYLQSVFGQGGFADTPGAAPDGNSDELAIQAILAANQQADQTWRSKLDQALAQLAGLQVASGADAGAISNPYSKLFATTFAPAAFLLRPLTIGGIAETAVPLLTCPASSTARPTPGVTTARLAQTGAAADVRLPIAGLVILLLGAGILRSRRRAPRR